MFLCTSALFLLLPLKVLTDTRAIYQLNNFILDAGKPLGAYFSNCDSEVGVALNPQITTKTYMNAVTSTSTYYSATAQNIPLNYNFTFNVPVGGDPYVISSTVVFDCRKTDFVYDYVVLLTQTKSNFNPTTNAVAGSGSVNSNLKVSASLSRSCNPGNLYGLNCDESCTPTNNSVFCYTCSPQGTWLCCQQANVNQQYCTYDGVNINPTTTTPKPDECTVQEKKDKNKETLYFWIMIGLAILSGILLIFLILCLLLLCRKNKSRQTVAPVYIEPVRKSEPIEAMGTERQNAFPERREAPPYPSNVYRIPSQERPAPSMPVHRGSYQLEYDIDDESLRDGWMEPMPRRVAKDDIQRRRISATEPKDVVV